MDKKEILEKAQTESVDEGLENAQNKGRLWGVGAFILVYVAVTIFNSIKNRSNDLPSTFMMAYIAAESIPEYIFTKKKIYIFTAVFGAIAAIISLISYITG